jgi:uncharacterized protein with HEPN domain
MHSDRVVSYLRDILKEIDLCAHFVAPLTLDEFENDDLRIRGVVRCLEIMSEASRRLPADLKARHPEIPWQAIAGAGNIYRHDYESLLTWKIWETAKGLGELREVVTQELTR